MSKKPTRRRAPAPDQLTGAEAFRLEARISASAAVGACFVRTSEPYDALRALEDMCVADKSPLRVWNIIRGWHTFDITQAALPVTAIDEEAADPIPALTKLYDVLMPRPGQRPQTGPAANLFPADAVCVMVWPDFYIKNVPQMRAILAEIARELPLSTQRLFMIVPPGFEMPDELAQLIPIIDFGLPTQGELLELYHSVRENDITDPQRELTREFTDADALSVCVAGAGMTRGEFAAALCKGYVSLEKRRERGIDAFRRYIQETKISVVKRSEVLEVLSPVSLDQIGGLGNLKDWMLMRRECFTPEAKEAGVDTPRGVALIGPPGTGKSAASKATGAALGVPVIRFDISRVFGSLVGESEARMSKALAMIDAMAPCVAFVDEIDKVFNVNSGGGDSGTSTRVLGKILTHMQETKHPIFWVLTANRTDNLPPELLRKGRLDEIFSVTTPTEEERSEILSIHLAMRGEDPDTFDLSEVIDASAGYVGGEIEQAVKDAKVVAFAGKKDLTEAHLVAAFKAMKPLSKTFEADFAKMEQWAEQHARPSSSVKKEVTGGGRARARTRQVSSGGRRNEDDMAG